MTERVILPIHGQDHCPGGPDPIPCLVNVPWIAVYDNVIYGQQVGDTEALDVRLKFLAAVVSDNGDDYFGVDTITSDPELGEDIYRPIIKQSGIYAFTFWLFYNDPSRRISIARFYFNTTATGFDFPGEVPSSFGSFRWDMLNNNPSEVEWTNDDFLYLDTAILPIKLNNNPVTPWTVDPWLIIMEHIGADFDIILNHKALWIYRLGPLNSTKNWPIQGIGILPE